MLCAMYLRKSRADQEAEQRGEGETLARHEATLREYAEKNRLQIVAVYRELVSGDTISDRPEMQRLLNAVGRGEYDAVLCMDIDRLGRGDGADQAVILKTMKYSQTIIITPYKSYNAAQEMDEEFIEYAQFMARGEYKRIKRRMWAGRVASAREGKWQSPKAPFGYKRVRIENGKGWTLEPIQPEADAVRNIFHWYGATNDGKNVIANRINAAGFRTLSGKLFVPDTIRAILLNPVYIGKVRWNYRRKHTEVQDGVEIHTRQLSDECFIADGLHPAIVDQAIWDAVQIRMSSNGESRRKTGVEIRNPLSGLMYCAECGKAMSYTPEYARKVAATYRCSMRGCKTSGIDVECVYAALLDALRGWVQLAAQPDSDDQTDTITNTQITAVREQLETLNAQMERLRDFLETGVYTVDVYLQRSKALQQRIDAANAELKRLYSDTAYRERESIRANLPKIQHAIDAWPTASAAERNTAMRQIVSRIVYHKTVRCARNGTPSQHLTLEVFPVIN